MKLKNIIPYLFVLFFVATPLWAAEQMGKIPVVEILLKMVLIVASIPLVVYIFSHYLLKMKGTLGYTVSGSIIGFVIGAMVDVIAAKDFVKTLDMYIIGLFVFTLIGSIAGNIMSHRNNS